MGGLQSENVRIANTHRMEAYLAKLGLGMDQVKVWEIPVELHSRKGENAYIYVLVRVTCDQYNLFAYWPC